MRRRDTPFNKTRWRVFPPTTPHHTSWLLTRKSYADWSSRGRARPRFSPHAAVDILLEQPATIRQLAPIHSFFPTLPSLCMLYTPCCELVATRDERCGSGSQLHRAGAVGDSEERLNGWPDHPSRDPLALTTVESRASARRLSRIACCRCLPPALMFLSVIVIDSSEKVFRCEAQLVKKQRDRRSQPWVTRPPSVRLWW